MIEAAAEIASKSSMASTLLLYFLMFLALNIITKHFLNRIRNLPPTPFPSLPILGHLHLLNRPFPRTLANLANRYGPIILFQFGSRQALVVSSPSLAEECLAKNDIVFANRPRLLFPKHFAYNYSSILWASYGDHWRNLRKIVSLEILSTQRLQSLSAIREEEVRFLISTLSQAKNQTGVVDMRKAFFELTFNIMMRMIAGKRYYGEHVSDAEEAERFWKNRAETIRLSCEAIFGDFLPWKSRSDIEKRVIEVQRVRDALFQNMVDEQRKVMAESGSNSGEREQNLIQVLLSLQQIDPGYYTDDMIKNLVGTLLDAGTETSIGTMEWAMSLLLNHPQVLQKVQMEIDDKIGSHRVVNETDVLQIPYLRCIINETLRMYPAAPFLVPHEAARDCKLGGFHIPKGTMLAVNVWAIQNDPKVWAGPTEFRPERFEGMDGIARDGFRLMPFGNGRRSCPGEGLATRVVGLTLASLIQCFDWKRSEAELVDMSEANRFAMSKAHGLEARCQPRSSMLNLLSQVSTG